MSEYHKKFIHRKDTQFVWKLCIPLKVKIFVWLTLKNRILTVVIIFFSNKFEYIYI